MIRKYNRCLEKTEAGSTVGHKQRRAQNPRKIEEVDSVYDKYLKLLDLPMYSSGFVPPVITDT